MLVSITTSGQLGPLLKRLRADKGWSQTMLGNRIGLSQERISKIESHPEKVPLDQLLTILMVLGATIRIDIPGTEASRSGTTEKESW